MSRPINSRELRRLYETMGPEAACRHLGEALDQRHLRAEDFSLRDLAESLIPDGREFVRLLDPRARSGGIGLVEAGGGVDTAAFSNITGQIVFAKIMEGFTAEPFVASRMVETIPTRFNGEKIPGIGGIGDEAETVDEGAVFPLAGVNEDWIETPATVKRGFIVPVTKEAIFFDRTNLVLSRAAEVGEFLGLNKEKRIIDCIIDENTTAHRLKWKGTTYATYQATSPWVNIVAANALVDWTDIDAAEQALANMTDPSTGEPIMVLADTLFVTPQLLHTARRTVNATEIRTGDGASGGTVTIGPNPLAPYQVVSSRLLRARLATDTTWFFGNFRKAFAYMENWPITVTQAPQNSEAEFMQDIVVRFKASERGAAATLEPRYVVKNTA